MVPHVEKYRLSVRADSTRKLQVPPFIVVAERGATTICHKSNITDMAPTEIQNVGTKLPGKHQDENVLMAGISRVRGISFKNGRKKEEEDGLVSQMAYFRTCI